MTGRASRDKGARGELDIVKMIRRELGIVCNRNYKQVAQAQHGDIEQIIGGHLIEVKNCVRLDFPKWWRQVCTAAAAHPDKPYPCLAYKAGRARWRFIIPNPEFWDNGTQWGRDVQYQRDLWPEGFFSIVRERL
jgi:hypothetical protein